MQKKTLYVLLFIWGSYPSFCQDCSSLTTPSDGLIDVAVDSEIRWTALNNIIGYVVSLGTTPGGVDIVNRRSSGQNNFYLPETGLPPDTQIYITISFFKEGQPYTTCEVETFRTREVTTPPNCTSLTDPANNSSNIEAEATLKWAYAATATGYLISIGTMPGQANILDRYDVGNILSYDPPNGLPADGPVYITIIPYNEIGAAPACTEESFITTSAVVNCGPYYDFETGQTITLWPTIDFPTQISLCSDQSSIVVASKDQAEGYRWFRIDSNGSETLISNTISVALSETGSYRYEAYNNIAQATTTFECPNTTIFTLISSGRAIVKSVDETLVTEGRNIYVNTDGDGNYEFSLDNQEGPYQLEPSFSNISNEFHTIYIRDQNGCGFTMVTIQPELSEEDFPKFFTPNGDSYNDFWQYVPPMETTEIKVETIQIFDRYGVLLAQIDPRSSGWDGNFDGRPLPSSDYWFRALAFNKKEVRGHFALKR